MVTFRQVARAYTSAAKAAEREQKRLAREEAKILKDQQKLLEMEDAINSFQKYEEYIDSLVSGHKTSLKSIDWRKIASHPEPQKPTKQTKYEKKAQKELSNFKPSFFDKLTGSKKKIHTLECNIDEARKKDQKEFEKLTESFEKQMAMRKIASGILDHNVNSYIDAMEYHKPFEHASELGFELNLSCEQDHIEIEMKVENLDIIPDYVTTLTSTGKLSRKNMPKSKRNELYKNYVCNGILMVARQIKSLLPIEYMLIHSVSRLVNPTTGHLEDMPIVSIFVPMKTLDELNFQNVNPAAAMDNFTHNIKFSSTKGFSPISKLDNSTLK